MKLLRMRLLLMVTLLGLGVGLTGCSDPCENTIDYTVRSEDGQRAVHVYQRTCGATTGFATHISIRSSDDEIGSSAGNLFTATAGEAKLTKKKTIKTEVVWKDKNHLLIRYDAKARVIKKVDQLNGISVQYETL